MTTFGTFDIDSVPAPSDYELEAADQDKAISIEHQALQLLADLYIMCCEAGDFSNGVTHNGIDEGNVLAGRVLAEAATFLKGKNKDFDHYASLYVSSDEDAAQLDPSDWLPF